MNIQTNRPTGARLGGFEPVSVNPGFAVDGRIAPIPAVFAFKPASIESMACNGGFKLGEAAMIATINQTRGIAA